MAWHGMACPVALLHVALIRDSLFARVRTSSLTVRLVLSPLVSCVAAPLVPLVGASLCCSMMRLRSKKLSVSNVKRSTNDTPRVGSLPR